MIVEVGAHSTLEGPMRQILKARDTELPHVSCLKRPEDGVDMMQQVACALIARGYPVNIKAVKSPPWVAGKWGQRSLIPTWRNFIRLSEIEWLKDHQIDRSVVFPGAGYIALALEAVRLLTDPSEATMQGNRLRDIDIMTAMVIPDPSSGLEIQLSLQS
ncbi:hypothetical protein KVR01_012448 [Diaporthe batatas]|uniref:uncharacterized protein n=1 Tax=Diaporthe batatas TaxID=748121 RepID=UPI001D041015|nr:uncharacterized protein KVR01_012448 [Diaporthe batatas]KAG8157786.1 hypothetical protein KVR01_012448 [Diaporthe batatas]